MTTQDHVAVDILSQDHDGTVVLTMIEPRDWSEIGTIIPDLEKKFSAYMNFILKGGVAAQKGLKSSDKARIDLRCQHIPSAKAQALFQQMLEFSTAQKVDFVVHHHANGEKNGKRFF
jgi:hypothetical protein